MPKTKPENSEERAIEGRAAFAAAAVEVAGRAQREIALLSYDLPTWAYGSQAFCTAVRELILNAPRANVRVLIHDAKTVATRGQPLIELLRQLSSYAEIRVLAEHQRGHQDDCLIADEHHLLERDTPDTPSARAHFDSPLAGRAARRRFDGLWESAEPASELRRLHL